MMDKAKGKDEEINKVILEWLITKNFNTAVEAFTKDTGLKREDASKGNALEKRWGTILTLQKKVSDMETQVKQLKEELERAGSGGIGSAVVKKENESMVKIKK
jgi:hypothetical protein